MATSNNVVYIEQLELYNFWESVKQYTRLENLVLQEIARTFFKVIVPFHIFFKLDDYNLSNLVKRK